MHTSITAYTTDETALPGHISLYRLLPEVAEGEDGRTNVYSFDDLRERLALQGFEHAVTIPNDHRITARVQSAADYLDNQSEVGLWTGAVAGGNAMFFFQRSSDAVAFKLTA